MKNTIKMSLVAAMAVAGLSSTAAAQPLEEAIKGVDVSGYVQYRYEESHNGLTGGAQVAGNQQNDYEAVLKIKAPVNDNVTANLKFRTDGTTADDAGTAGSGNSNATNAGDTDTTLTLQEANFAFATGYATIVAGKQSIPGPFDDGRTGTGLVALIPAGPATIVAGHFVNNDGSVTQNDATELAVMAPLGPVNFEAYYLTIADVLDGWNVAASANVGPVSISAAHTEMELDSKFQTQTAANDNNEASLTKLIVSGKVADITLTAGYALTGKGNGQNSNRIAMDADNDAKSDFKVFQASYGALNDADGYLLSAAMPLGPVTASLTYTDVDFGTSAAGNANSEADELLGKVVYPMSKNFKVTAMYSQYEVSTAGTKTTDRDKGRLELKYTF